METAVNAYELTDQVKEISTAIEALEWVQKAAPLLLKQAKEIERLIGAEPITYGMLTFCKNCGQQNPYFTLPKELSDEEIDLKWWISSFEHLKALGGGISDEMETKLKDMKERLKKASEK